MSIVSAALGALSNLSGLILAYFKKAERAEYREAGTVEERARTLEGNIDAAKRKKEVERETDRISNARLRDALGRFVSDDGTSNSDK